MQSDWLEKVLRMYAIPTPNSKSSPAKNSVKQKLKVPHMLMKEMTDRRRKTTTIATARKEIITPNKNLKRTPTVVYKIKYL
jgi:hypothetical protein